MILGEVFERFVAESPFSVMLRVLMEQSLPAEEVDAGVVIGSGSTRIESTADRKTEDQIAD